MCCGDKRRPGRAVLLIYGTRRVTPRHAHLLKNLKTTIDMQGMFRGKHILNGTRKGSTMAVEDGESVFFGSDCEYSTANASC
jgi:hypothetical protein